MVESPRCATGQACPNLIGKVAECVSIPWVTAKCEIPGQNISEGGFHGKNIFYGGLGGFSIDVNGNDVFGEVKRWEGFPQSLLSRDHHRKTASFRRNSTVEF